VRQQRQETQVAGLAQLGPIFDLHRALRVFGSNHDPMIGAGVDASAGAKADGGVDRLRAGMEEIQRPDVDRAARQVDARRRRGLDMHAGIIKRFTGFAGFAEPREPGERGEPL
jgi:hypothetical protein